MTTKELLDRKYPGRVTTPRSARDIPCNKRMVYVLTIGDKAIVVGHGKKNRAKIIFDDKNQITSDHIKAIFVRAHCLFGPGEFQRFTIECKDTAEAEGIEGDLHREIGGNTRDLPSEIKEALFKDIADGSVPFMVLRMALCSSFSGIADLKRWRSEGILDDSTWNVVGDRLKLTDPKR